MQVEIEMNQSICSLENLSNKVFYEIFDYLNGMHLYQALSTIDQCFLSFIQDQ